MDLEEVKIELTSYCKRGCIHCSSNADLENVISLDFDKVKEIIDECARLHVKSIVLTGGEATEYPYIKDIVKYIKDKNFDRIKLYSMCDPNEEKLVFISKLHDLGLTDFIYSLTVSLTTDGVVNFSNAQKFLIEVSHFMDVSLHYCLTKKTIEDIEKVSFVIDKLDFNHFKTLSFLRYVEHGRGDATLTLSSTELKKLKPTLIHFMEKYPDKIHLGSPFNILGLSYTPCTASRDTMIVGVDGNVYGCDAMKYFSFLGSGGNIYVNSLEEIYYSTYFVGVREASILLSDTCKACSNKTCLGGCLGQKMLSIMRENGDPTVEWYQENALRTLNDFGSREMLKFNAYTGITGECGEFFDYMKKLYTHSLSPEKKEEILTLAPNELGDLVWYLSAPLALYYDYTLDDIYSSFVKREKLSYKISADLIKMAGENQDPLCPFLSPSSYRVDMIYDFIPAISSDVSIFSILMEFKSVINQVDTIKDREDAISVVRSLFIQIARLSRFLFHQDLSEILKNNIVKLRARYPEGFDSVISNQLVDFNKKYRKEQETRVTKVYQK